MRALSRFDALVARVYYGFGVLSYFKGWLLALFASGTVTASFSAHHLPRLATGTLVVAAAISLALVALVHVRDVRHRSSGRNPGLQIRQAHCTYEICGNHHYRSTRRVHARALYPGVQEYLHRFRWSGSDGVSVADLSPEISSVTVGPAEDTVGALIARVRLKSPLRKAEPVSFSYALVLDDSAGQSKRLFSLTSYDFIYEKATLCVLFSDGVSRPSRFTTRVFLSENAAIPMETEEHELPPGRAEAEWSIPRPRFGSKYLLTW